MESKFLDGSFPMKIGDIEFNASTLTDKDYADLDGYIKSVFINIAINSSKNLEEDFRKELISVALKEAINIGWSSEEGIDIISTTEGCFRLGYQMCRKRHPNLSFNDFKKEASKKIADSVEQINIAYRTLNSIVGDDGGSSTENSKSDSKSI